MRISVCEFLRLATMKNWFYVNPGHWASDGLQFECKRDEVNPDLFHLYKGKRHVKELRYFAGMPAHEVRRNNVRGASVG